MDDVRLRDAVACEMSLEQLHQGGLAATTHAGDDFDHAVVLGLAQQLQVSGAGPRLFAGIVGCSVHNASFA